MSAASKPHTRQDVEIIRLALRKDGISEMCLRNLEQQFQRLEEQYEECGAALELAGERGSAYYREVEELNEQLETARRALLEIRDSGYATGDSLRRVASAALDSSPASAIHTASLEGGESTEASMSPPSEDSSPAKERQS